MRAVIVNDSLTHVQVQLSMVALYSVAKVIRYV